MDNDPDFENGVITAGSEFGAVDNPATGGTGDPGTTGNWYTGAWGDNIASTEDHGVALPASTLQKFGYKGQEGFGPAFNSQYQINLLDPDTGEPKIQDVGLKDLGPGRHTQKGIDLMYRTAREYGQAYNSGGKVAFQIVPRSSLAGQSEEANSPEANRPEQAAAPSAPAPSWSEIQNSDSFQSLQPEQQQQVLDKWHQDTYTYANSQKGFSADARNALYDFYNQKKQELQPKPQDIGTYGQQVWNAAKQAASEIKTGQAQAALQQQQPPPIFPEPAEITAARAERDKAYNQQQLQEGTRELAEEQKEARGLGKPMPGTREIGGALPVIAGGVAAGPLGPAGLAATGGLQMGSQGYFQALPEAKQMLAKEHPEWNEDQLTEQAHKVAQQVSQINMIGGAALGATGGAIPIKALIPRVIANMGLGAATQGAVAGGVQAASNVALRQPIGQGVPEAIGQGAAYGGVLGGVNAIGAPVRSLKAGEETAPGEWAVHPPEEAPRREPIRPVQPPETQSVPPSATGEAWGQGKSEYAHSNIYKPEGGRMVEQNIPQSTKDQITLGLESQGHTVVPFHDYYKSIVEGDKQSIWGKIGTKTTGYVNPTEEAILNAVPPDTKVAIIDPSKPANIGPKNWQKIDMSDAAGGYHRNAKGMIFIRNNAIDIRSTLLHEAMHVILDGHGNDPDILKSWENAKLNAGKLRNLAADFRYALSNTDEHMAAAVSNPFYQAFIGKAAMQDIANAVKRISGIDPRDSEANAVVRSALLPSANSPSRTFGTKTVNSIQSIWRSGLGMLKDISPDLATRMQNWRMEQALQRGKVNQLQEKWQQLLKKNPNLDNEIDMLGQQSLGLGIRPNQQMSPEAAEWLKLANNGLYREHADLMRSLGGQVSLGGGKTRPFIGAAAHVTPFPRILRPDYAEVLKGQMTDASGNLLPEAARIYNEGAQTIDRNTGKPFWSSPQEFLAKAQEYRNLSITEGNGPRLSGIERGRELNFPDRFYTFGGNAMIDRLYKEADSLARIKAFGQTFSGTGDAFQRELTRIAQNTSLPEAQRAQAQNIIKTLQDYAYGGKPMGPLGRFVKGVSSVGFAANPFTSTKIGIGMTANVATRFGIPRTLAAAWHNLTHMPEVHDLLNRTDLLAKVDRNALAHDLYANSPHFGPKIVGEAMKWSGHQLSQNYGRALTATAARIELEAKYIPALQHDPMLQSAVAREAAQEIDKLGLNHHEFAQQNVPGELRDKFVQGSVMSLQTNYYPERYPTWSNTPMGRMMGQFGHWGYTASESLNNNYIKPFSDALVAKDFSLAGRYIGRILQAGAGILAGAEGYAMLKTAFGRPDQQGNWQELWQGLVQHKPIFAKMMMQRLSEDIIASPVVGLFGDYYNKLRGIFKGEATNASTSFDPLSPAGIGYLKVATDIINKAAQQGWKLSGKTLSQEFMKEFSEYRELYYGAARAGAPLPGGGEVKGYDERNFARRSLDLYRKLYTHEKVYGEYVTGPNKPYEDDIQDALYRGDAAAARSLAAKMMKERGLSPKQLSSALTRSIDAQAPIPTGPERAAFLKAAPEFLTHEELQRIQSIDKRYSETALQAGLIKRMVGEHAHR